MSETKQDCLIFALIAVLMFIGAFIGVSMGHKDSERLLSELDDTRDYDYEYYCDSMKVHNPEYYFNVLIETEKYNDYVNEHGYWNNSND